MDRNVIAAQASKGESLHLYLFGRFRLEDAQRPIPLPTRKVEALLAYLALHPEMHAREKLALRWAAEGEPIDVVAGLRLGGA